LAAAMHRQYARPGSKETVTRTPAVAALPAGLGNRAAGQLLRAPSGGRKRILVSIQGEKQGVLKGEAKDGKIEGMTFKMGAVSPRDVATGQASGKRQHKALSFTKAWDAASPQLFQALTTNEKLPMVKFEFVGPSPDGGGDQVFQKITLTGASIASVDQTMEDGNDVEEVSIVFQSILMENVRGTSTEDTTEVQR
jgi:type VI secretion system secreted protein Hcp